MSRKKNNRQSDFDFLTESAYINDKYDEIKKNGINETLSTLPEIKIIAKNESQKNLIVSIKNNEITICAGRAGTGKTYVALGIALGLIRKNNEYEKLYLVKSVKTLKEEELGFLKGQLMDKLEPVMQSFFLNIKKLIPSKLMGNLITNEVIIPFPVAFMRGVTLDDCIIVVDEVQNITIDNIRTIMTRIGTNCKLIILGDYNQIDLENKNESSLKPLLEMFTDVDKIGVINMSDEDENVRNPLIKTIEEKFNKYKENNKRKH